MSDQEQFIGEALQKAAHLASTVEERYQEAAFPIILKTLIGASVMPKGHSGSIEGNGHNVSEQMPLLNMSVNEFFRRAAPDTHPGRFVCAAYYLLHSAKAEQFTQTDILDIYGKLRQPKPKNPTDVMNQCIRKAYIIDAPSGSDKQKSWVITPEGEKYTEGLLNGNAANSNSIAG